MNDGCIKKRNVTAVLLVGIRDFGRCPLASRMPTALWPIGSEPVLKRLLQHLSRQGIRKAVICSNGDGQRIKACIGEVKSLELEFLAETLPLGTAGCIREAASGQEDELFLVLPGQMTLAVDVERLLAVHELGKSDMTVVFGPENNNSKTCNAEIYICEMAVLKYIQPQGYCDIKEGLIPVMARAGAGIHAAVWDESFGNFRDSSSYLAAMTNCLNKGEVDKLFSGKMKKRANGLILLENASVDPTVRTFGPVVIMNNSRVAEQSVIFSPTIVGPNVSVGSGTLIENSVLWAGSSVGDNCRISNCVLDYNAAIPNGQAVRDQAIIYKHIGKVKTAAVKVTSLLNGGLERVVGVFSQVDRAKGKPSLPGRWNNLLRNTGLPIATVVLIAGFIWSYWPQITELWSIWQRSDEYSCGMLVPFLAIYILWARRVDILSTTILPSIWGVLGFAVAQAIRYFGVFFMYSSAERLSLVMSIGALVLWLFGWRLFWRVSTVLLFLFLMLPLPASVHAYMTLPLQSMATTSSVFCLETLGFAVVREGNLIHINDTVIAIAEACNGLRMITSFFIITALVVLLVNRAWWEKLIVLASNLGVALLCNTVRLTVTAIAFTQLSGPKWEAVFHDFGGYAMMPLALAIVLFEFWLLETITTIPQQSNQKIIIHRSVA